MIELSVVIIGTQPRALQHVVESANVAAAGIAHEILVVHQGPGEYTPQPDHPTVTALNFPNLLGSSGARNAGLDVARGRFACCLDQDIAVDPKFFSFLLPLLRARPEISAAMGRLVVAGDDRSLLFGKFRSAPPGRLGRFRLWRLANGNTMVFRHSGQRFDEQLGVGRWFGAFEDADFLLRQHELGEVHFVRGAVLYHPDMEQQERLDPDRMRRYGRGLGGCFAKNPSWAALWFWAASIGNNLLNILNPARSRLERRAHGVAVAGKLEGFVGWCRGHAAR